jgi:hypothetical protein
MVADIHGMTSRRIGHRKPGSRAETRAPMLGQVIEIVDEKPVQLTVMRPRLKFD